VCGGVGRSAPPPAGSPLIMGVRSGGTCHVALCAVQISQYSNLFQLLGRPYTYYNFPEGAHA
jgi:hypothetical protein